MVIKPVRLLCYVFLWTWWCTTLSSIPIILILLIDKNVGLIYSVTICQQQKRIVHHNEAPKINCNTVVFISDICCPSYLDSYINYDIKLSNWTATEWNTRLVQCNFCSRMSHVCCQQRSLTPREEGEERERPLLAQMRSSRNHLPHSLVFKTGLAYLECACPVETASWKFLSPQLLSRGLVL